MISRRTILCGLFAAPAVVAVGSLMPLRGIKYDPIVRLQSWKFGTEAKGEWWAHEGPLSRVGETEDAIRSQLGQVYWEEVDHPANRVVFTGLEKPEDRIGWYPTPDTNWPDGASKFGVSHGVNRIDLLEPENDDWIKEAYKRATQRRLELVNDEDFIKWEKFCTRRHEKLTDIMIDRLDSICKWGI